MNNLSIAKILIKRAEEDIQSAIKSITFAKNKIKNTTTPSRKPETLFEDLEIGEKFLFEHQATKAIKISETACVTTSPQEKLIIKYYRFRGWGKNKSVIKVL